MTLVVLLIDKESPLDIKKYLEGTKTSETYDLLLVISNRNKFLLEFSFEQKKSNQRIFFLYSEKKRKSDLFQDAFDYMSTNLNVKLYDYVAFPRDMYRTSCNSIRRAIYGIERKESEALILKKKVNYFFSKPLLYIYEQKYLRVTKINPFKKFSLN